MGVFSECRDDAVRMDLGYVVVGAVGCDAVVGDDGACGIGTASGLVWLRTVVGLAVMTNPALGVLLPFLLGWAAMQAGATAKDAGLRGNESLWQRESQLYVACRGRFETTLLFTDCSVAIEFAV